MTKIYGGLLFPNLVAQDECFHLQMKLYELGIIKGIQILVAHPIYTPGVTVADLPKIFSALPKELEIIIHCGAENKGVDPGETYDEKGEFKKRAAYRNWATWNKETLAWALKIAEATATAVVVHPGYGKSIHDTIVWRKIITALQQLDNCTIPILLENVPPIIIRNQKSKKLWGFGGTPDNMIDIITATSKQCLIDFTHLWVMVNQANKLNRQELSKCRDVEKVIAAYLSLPHSNICHFSGLPNTIVDNHNFLNAEVNDCVRNAIRQMDAVCLEIPYRPKNFVKIRKDITSFRKRYLN